MEGIIYKTTNLVNGKIYIGSDTKNFGLGDPVYLGSGLLIINAIRKYGSKNFTKETLHSCNTIDELKEKESYYIKKYESNNRKIGYNISDGYWGGNTLTNHPDILSIKQKISIKIKENSEKIKEAQKKYYSKESDEQKLKRIAAVKEGMKNMDRSFLSDPSYKKNLSKGIKDSEKFQEYNERRSGSKRGKYSIDTNSHIKRRKEEISKINTEFFKSILEGLIDKDHSTFYCYLKVYLHLEGKEMIEGLDLFIEYLEKNIYDKDINHIDIRKKYIEIGLENKKLGKSMTVLKSLYIFNLSGYPQIIINPVRSF